VQLTDSSAARTTSLDLTGGTFNNNAGGELRFALGSGGARSYVGGLNNSGTVNVNTDTTFTIGNQNIENLSGGTFSIVTLKTATIAAGGSGQFHNNAGATLTVTLLGGLNMNGHNLLNDGTIGGIGVISMGGGTYTNNGTSTITPGASPGHLTIDGSAVFGHQTSTEIELAGTGDTQHDLLTVTGNFQLGGNLDVIGYHGYVPHAGDSFQVLNYGSATGMFDEANGLDAFSGLAIDPVFSADQLVLTTRVITLEGTTGSDVLTGTAGDDVIVGHGGGDIINGGAGNDLIIAGDGTNTLIGGAGDDHIIGGHGTDTVDYSADPGPVHVDLSQGTATDGFGGHDTLISIENVIGTAFADTIIGNQKDNVIVGNGGADILTGGGGANTFVLRGLADSGVTITDFVSGTDTIAIGKTGGLNIAAGLLTNAQNFSDIVGSFTGQNAGTNAAFAAGKSSFIYSEADHTLYYDDNGAQEGYTVVAHLQPNAHLAATDVRITEHAFA
jgi:Ca2+-binding RTX toxin-like protein